MNFASPVNCWFTAELISEELFNPSKIELAAYMNLYESLHNDPFKPLLGSNEFK